MYPQGPVAGSIQAPGGSIWASLASHRPKSLLMSSFCLLAAGTWSALQLPGEWAPSPAQDSVTVIAVWPGASPGAIERSVTAPLERALERLPGTSSIESESREGLSLLRVEVSEGRAFKVYVAELSDRLAALRRSLPDRVFPRVSQGLSAALQSDDDFMTLQLVGTTDPGSLRQIAEDVVAPRLRSLSGISFVSVEGGVETELLVSLREERLFRYGLTEDGVREKLSEALQGRSFGYRSDQGGQQLLWMPGASDVVSLAGLALETRAQRFSLPLSQVAELRVGPAPIEAVTRVDGKAVVSLRLGRAPGGHLLVLADRVRKMAEELERELPRGSELRIADDRSEDVRKELRYLALCGLLGLAAMLAVLAAVLRSCSAAGIVLLAAAVGLSFAPLLMLPLGLSINSMTLAGLMILTVLLVSHASLVVQPLARECGRRAYRKADYETVVAYAFRSAWIPLLGSTLSMALVLLSLLDCNGGYLIPSFAPFAAIAALTLLLFVPLSALLIPVLGRCLGNSTRRMEGRRLGRRILRAPLVLSLRRPATFLTLLALAIGLPTPLLPDYQKEPDEGWSSASEERAAERYNATLGSDSVRRLRSVLDPFLGGVTRPFLRNIEWGEGWSFDGRPQLTVWIKMPPGSRLERADELVRHFESRALAARTVGRTLTRVTESFAMLRVVFADGALDTREPFRLREAMIRQALQMAGVEISISGLLPAGFYSGFGEASGLRVDAFGPSYEDLEHVVNSFAKQMARDPRVAAVDTNSSLSRETLGREVLQLRWRADTVARTGVNVAELSARLRSQLMSRSPSFVTQLEGNPQMRIRVVTAGGEDRELERLLEHPLHTAKSAGGSIRLAELAEMSVRTRAFHHRAREPAVQTSSPNPLSRSGPDGKTADRSCNPLHAPSPGLSP